MLPILRPYPAYEPSGVPWLGDVPEHWEVVPNRVLMNLKKDVVGNYADNYTLLSLTKQGIIARDLENASGKFPTNFDTYQIVRPGDLIFCLFDIDETPRTVGLSTLYGMITGAYTRFICTDETTREYLFLLYLAFDNDKLLKPLYSGLRKVISKTTFLSAKVGLPPKEEQAAIARYLDHADRRILRYLSARQKLTTLLQEEKQAIISQVVTRGLDPNVPLKPSGVEWLGDVPAHWEVQRLGTLLQERGEINDDGHVSEVLSVLRDRGVIPYAEKGNIGNKKSEDITRYKIVRPDDIVVNSMNVIIGSVGLSTHTGCLSPVYYVLTRRSKDDDPQYLNAYFQTKPFQQSLVRIGNGILAHRMRIPMELFKSEPFPRPPLAEQTAIVDYLDKATAGIDAAIGRARRQIELLREYRTRLISDVVTGKLDVRAAAAQLPEQPDDQEPMDEGDPTEDMDSALDEADDAADEAVV